MKTNGLWIVVAWLALSQTVPSAVFRYDITKGEKRGRVEWRTTNTPEEAVELSAFNSAENVRHRAVNDRHMQTVEWTFSNPDARTNYQVKRIGNRLLINGMIKGQSVDDSVQVEDLPWYQFHGLSFPRLLANGEREINFISIRPDNGRVVELQAAAQGLEEITIKGQSVQALRVDVRIRGVLASLGKVSYWFRASDYLFVRFQGASPFGGGQAVVYELAEGEAPPFP